MQKLLDAVESGDLEAIKEIAKGMLAEAASGEAPPADADALADAPEEPPADEEMGAAAGLLKRLAKADTIAEAEEVLSAKLARVDAIDAERAEFELEQRRELIAELVKLDVETPATAWQGDTDEARAKRIPVKRLSAAAESLSELKARVKALKASRPEPREPAPPARGPRVEASKRFSRAQLAAAKAKGLTPEQFAEAVDNAARRSA